MREIEQSTRYRDVEDALRDRGTNMQDQRRDAREAMDEARRRHQELAQQAERDRLQLQQQQQQERRQKLEDRIARHREDRAISPPPPPPTRPAPEPPVDDVGPDPVSGKVIGRIANLEQCEAVHISVWIPGTVIAFSDETQPEEHHFTVSVVQNREGEEYQITIYACGETYAVYHPDGNDLLAYPTELEEFSPFTFRVTEGQDLDLDVIVLLEYIPD